MSSKKFNQVRLLTRQFESREDNVAFDFQSRCVCALFARFARAHGAELPDAWAIAGEFHHSPQTVHVTSDGETVARVIQVDDIRGVMSLPDSERKRAFLHLILRTLDVFFGGATPQAYLDAAADVRAADFLNTWVWTNGATRSPDRQWRAAVTIVHELREFEIRLSVDDAGGNPGLEQVLVRGDTPDEDRIDGWLGELRWEGSDRVVLQPKAADQAPLVVDLPALA